MVLFFVFLFERRWEQVRLGSTRTVNLPVDGPSPKRLVRLEMRFEKMEPSDFDQATLEFRRERYYKKHTTHV